MSSIKVSSKGQITLPKIIQREFGIKKGDELLLISKDKNIILEKPEIAIRKIDTFEDIQKAAELSVKALWNNKEDEIWNLYLKGGKKWSRKGI
ncbi:MAG: AbrB/MazE/SpoVT family DNA-binding domain-containing protein [Candidatus Aenigmarchaeota archaeon]|nr:AbrB/MazE/SpoVT family DNA-binding domain-containing protein [Candidatus Aenigmarchaeota archaeon]